MSAHELGFSIVVDNVGHGGITVPDVGLHADSANGERVSVRRLREAGIVVRGPDLPDRIDGSRITRRGGWTARTPQQYSAVLPEFVRTSSWSTFGTQDIYATVVQVGRVQRIGMTCCPAPHLELGNYMTWPRTDPLSSGFG